jgi:galactose mutarotase-like enzyme
VPVQVAAGALGDRTFDDAYLAPPDGAPFVLEGGGRRIELALEAGYPYSQVFAPPGQALIAFEPMTAPTNALVTGGPALPLVGPGEEYRAVFSISVR